ncbi:MAG TPA: aminotransferase class V-fold PLP-dependent enzyme [Candidatus Limnocylindria bacterium]|nr:aminotransferase class V-fold PLP-dependent enzyme [Candidatus Limnocylindria bacterium]
MTFVDERPDVSVGALQALNDDFLYFNVAGSGPTFPVAQRAAEAYRTWLNGVGMFSHVGYDSYNAELCATRADLAAFIGDPDGAPRIALTQSATDGLNTLIASLPLHPGALIVTTAEEHPAALLPVYRRQDRGDRVRVVQLHDDERFLSDLRLAFRDGAQALVLSLVSCRTGRRLPVEAACQLARDAGALSIVDCAQALGQVPVDVRALGADATVFLGHKWLHGPLATGAAWIADPGRWTPSRVGWRSRADHDLEGHLKLNDDATRFEIGTVDVAAFVGIRQTLAVHRALGDTVGRRVKELRGRVLRLVNQLPFDLLGRADDPTGIVVVQPRAGGAAEIVQRAWDEDRVVIKHVGDQSMDAIRISFWALHRDADVDRLATVLSKQLAVRV